MKFGIDIGHNCPPDTGAAGIKKEDVMTKEVGIKVIDKLKKLGHQVINCTPNYANSVMDSLAQRCNKANANRVDVFVSLHFNAFNKIAKGTEVFAVSDNGRKFAQPVLDNIVKLGYFNRKVKDGSHLYVLRNTNMPSILIECAFCDSKEDMDRYNAEALADAIVKGLTGKTPTEPPKSEPQPPASGTDPKPPSSGTNPNPNPTNPASNTTVLKLQQALNKLQIKDSSGKALVEDGTMDPQTQSAIKKFESIVGINPANLIAGSDTWSAINHILAKPILRPNHAGGPAVRYLQHRLGIEIDGVYGVGTTNAVIKFQKQQNLVDDGAIGPQSWEKLIGK